MIDDGECSRCCATKIPKLNFTGLTAGITNQGSHFLEVEGMGEAVQVDQV